MESQTPVIQHAGEGRAEWSMGQLRQGKLIARSQAARLTMIEVVQPVEIAARVMQSIGAPMRE